MLKSIVKRRESNTNRADKILLIPVSSLMNQMSIEIARLDEDASYSISLKRVLELLLIDELRMPVPKLEEQFESLISEYCSFDIDRVEILTLLRKYGNRLERVLKRYGCTYAGHWTFKWKAGNRAILVWEEDCVTLPRRR